MTQHATQIFYPTHTLHSFVVFSFPPSAPVATVDSWEVRKSAQILGVFLLVFLEIDSSVPSGT